MVLNMWWCLCCCVEGILGDGGVGWEVFGVV